MGALVSRTTIIETGRPARYYWLDLWEYRELFAVLAWRDLSVRYKQTAIGILWAVVRPLLTVIVFTIVFGRVAKLPSEGNVPYPLMVFAGTLPWTMCSTGLSEASNSLITNANLITKVYFPRIILPAATMIVSLVDFAISCCIFAAMLVWYNFVPGWKVLLLPLFLLLAVLATAGPAFWITALNVKYRDFRYVIPFLIQLGLYVSPVGFSSSAVPERWRLLYSLNPMVAIIDGFRWCLLNGQSEIYLPGLAVGLAITCIFLFLGIRRFRAMEKSLADII